MSSEWICEEHGRFTEDEVLNPPKDYDSFETSLVVRKPLCPECGSVLKEAPKEDER